MNTFKRFLPIIVFSITIIALYFSNPAYPFISIDDGGQVLENTKLHSFSLQNLKEIFTTDVVAMYTPIPSLCFAIIIALFGIKTATAFHVFSILLHILNTFLVYQLGRRLFSKKLNPYILPLLFAVHPLAVEVVSWVSATSTLMFTACFLGATIMYDKYLNERNQKSYRSAILLFLVGCFCKVQIVPFVGVLFLLDYLRENRLIIKSRLKEKIPFLLIAAIFVIISLYFRKGQSGFVGNYNPIYLFPSQLVWYIYKTFIPLELGIVYDWPENPFNLWVFFSMVFLGIISVLTYFFRRNKLFLFGLLFFLGNIILHTVLVTKFLGPYADRYAYLSSLGIWIALLSLLKNSSPKILTISFSVVLILFFIMAKIQTNYWVNTIELWTNNLKHQKSTFSNGMRANLYYEKGMLAEAKADFLKVDAKPDYRFEPEKYGYLYNALGKMVQDTNTGLAAEYYTKAAMLYPNVPNFMNAAQSHKKNNDIQTAEKILVNGLIKSNNPQILMALSSLFFETKQNQKGENLMNKAISNGFQNSLIYKMRCYFRTELGKNELAKEDLGKAKELLKAEGVKVQDPILMSLEMRLDNK
jgi:Tfp pilus assembly protein PilF